jgi:hypothetical protein
VLVIPQNRIAAMVELNQRNVFNFGNASKVRWGVVIAAVDEADGDGDDDDGGGLSETIVMGIGDDSDIGLATRSGGDSPAGPFCGSRGAAEDCSTAPASSVGEGNNEIETTEGVRLSIERRDSSFDESKGLAGVSRSCGTTSPPTERLYPLGGPRAMVATAAAVSILISGTDRWVYGEGVGFVPSLSGI